MVAGADNADQTVTIAREALMAKECSHTNTIRKVTPSALGWDLAVACRHEVETSAELENEESRTVLADNALKLFPRLAAARGQRGRMPKPCELGSQSDGKRARRQ
jgi:hypothetical protein